VKRTQLARRTGLARKTPLRAVPPRFPTARVSAATPGQKAKIAETLCAAMGHSQCAGPLDPAHLIDRSLAPSFGDDPLMVVPLCRRHHDLYDDHRLDLSPYLEPRYREEVACAVRAVGLFRALARITGLAWQPVDEQVVA
jgi:hypothetical protein